MQTGLQELQTICDAIYQNRATRINQLTLQIKRIQAAADQHARPGDAPHASFAMSGHSVIWQRWRQAKHQGLAAEIQRLRHQMAIEKQELSLAFSRKQVVDNLIANQG